MIDRLIAAIVAGFSEALWKALVTEAKVFRSDMTYAERVKTFDAHLDEIKKGDEDEATKNNQLDALARTLLYGVRGQ